MNRFTLMVVAVAGLSVLPVPARAVEYAPSAVPAPQEPGYREHDGFYLRMELGGGYSRSAVSANDYSVAGGTVGFSLAIGGVVGKNNVLFGEVGNDMASEPTVRYGAWSGTMSGASSSLVNYSVGFLHYFMPANVYFGGSLGVGRLVMQWEESATVAGMTEFGPVVRLVLGKEWWVSRNWGLGASLHLTGASTPDGGDGPTIATSAMGLSFSATFN